MASGKKQVQQLARQFFQLSLVDGEPSADRVAGALAYLVKPFQKSDLIPAIEVAIGRFREMQVISGERDKLEEQLETRKSIDRAKGILMDEVGLKEQEAFAFIQRTAMSERTKMRDVAERVIAGELRPSCWPRSC